MERIESVENQHHLQEIESAKWSFFGSTTALSRKLLNIHDFFLSPTRTQQADTLRQTLKNGIEPAAR